MGFTFLSLVSYVSIQGCYGEAESDLTHRNVAYT
jgi:hypothetical protein